MPPSWADQSVPPGVAPVTSVTTAHWGAHNRITLHNTDQHTIYCNMPLNATAWKTKSKSLLLISPVGEDIWHDGASPQSSFSCVHYFNFFQFLNLSEIIVTPPAGSCSQPLSGPHSAMTTLQTGTQLSPLCRIIMMAARAGRISQYVAVWGWSVQEMVYCWGTPPGLNWPKQYQYLVNY